MKLVLTTIFLLLFLAVSSICFWFESYKKGKKITNLEVEIENLKNHKDYTIYWIGSSAYYLDKCQLKKVNNVNDLIKLRAEGYK